MENKFEKSIVNLEDYQGDILTRLRNGIAITASANGRTNSMTISWGMIGIQWNRPLFITVVRTGRFTHRLLMDNPEFTVNIPLDQYSADVLRYLGTHSGHTEDKISSLGLHLVDSPNVSVCGIAELPLTLECRVVYRQTQQPDLFVDADNIRRSMYPQNVPSSHCGNNSDFHTAFYGEIVGAYIIK